jgi:hypothetical protein
MGAPKPTTQLIYFDEALFAERGEIILRHSLAPTAWPAGDLECFQLA